MKVFEYENIICPNCGYRKPEHELKNCSYCNGLKKINSGYILITRPEVAGPFTNYEAQTEKRRLSPKKWAVNNECIIIADRNGLLTNPLPVKIHKTIVREVCEQSKLAIMILEFSMTVDEVQVFKEWRNT